MPTKRKLLGDFHALSQGTAVPAVITDVVGSLCSITLKGSGERKNAVRFYGPAPVVGQIVTAEESNGVWVVQGSGTESAATVAAYSAADATNSPPAEPPPGGDSPALEPAGDEDQVQYKGPGATLAASPGLAFDPVNTSLKVSDGTTAAVDSGALIETWRSDGESARLSVRTSEPTNTGKVSRLNFITAEIGKAASPVGRVLGVIGAWGSWGSDWTASVAELSVFATQEFSATVNGAGLRIKATPDDTNALVTVAEFRGDVVDLYKPLDMGGFAVSNFALDSAKIFLGNVSNIGVPVALTGDLTINNTGVTAIGAGKVTPAMLAVASAQYKYLVSNSTPFAYAESPGGLNIASGKIPVFSNSLSFSGADGMALVLTTSLTNQGGAGVLNWGGAFTLTVPATGTAALLGVANVFSQLNTFTSLKLSTGLIYPSADSTTALKVTKSDASTVVMDFDTTNGFVGVGTTPSNIFHIARLDGGSHSNQPVLIVENTDGTGSFNHRSSLTLRSKDSSGASVDSTIRSAAGDMSFILGGTSTGVTISGSNASTALGGGAPYLAINNTDPTTNNYEAIQFGPTAVRAGIYAKNINIASNYADLIFATRDADGFLSRLYIKSTGIITAGINSSAGAARFNVIGNTDINQLSVLGHTTQTLAIGQITAANTGAGIQPMLRLTALGSQAANDGGSLYMAGKSNGTADRTMSFFDWRWKVSADASRTAAARWYVSDFNADRLVIEIESTGTAGKLGLFGAPPVVQQLATTDLGVVLSNLGARAAGTAYPITTTGLITLGRVYRSGGTAIAVGDVALGAGWGAGAIVTAVTGNDSRGTITVTTSVLDTPLATPILTLTFKDGSWTTVPFATANMVGGSTGLLAGTATNCTATTLVITYEGTPTALLAGTYIFTYQVVG